MEKGGKEGMCTVLLLFCVTSLGSISAVLGYETCVSNICSRGTFGLSCTQQAVIRVTDVRLNLSGTSAETIATENLKLLCNGQRLCAANGLRQIIRPCRLIGARPPVVAVTYSCLTGKESSQPSACGVVSGAVSTTTAALSRTSEARTNSNQMDDPRKANRKLRAVVSYVFLTVAVLAAIIAIVFVTASYVKYYRAGQYHIESSERSLLRKGDETPMDTFRVSDEEVDGGGPTKTDRLAPNNCKDPGQGKTVRNGGLTTFAAENSKQSGPVLYSAIASETPRKTWASVGPASFENGACADSAPPRAKRFARHVEHYVVNDDEYAFVQTAGKGGRRADDVYAAPHDYQEATGRSQGAPDPCEANFPRGQPLTSTCHSQINDWEDEFY